MYCFLQDEQLTFLNKRFALSILYLCVYSKTNYTSTKYFIKNVIYEHCY